MCHLNQELYSKHIDMAEGHIIFQGGSTIVVVGRYSLVNAIIDFKNAVYFNEVRFLFNGQLAMYSHKKAFSKFQGQAPEPDLAHKRSCVVMCLGIEKRRQRQGRRVRKLTFPFLQSQQGPL